MERDLSKITNVLIFKDGYYWLTEAVYGGAGPLHDIVIGYQIAEADRNGFEFASDAYSYIAHLQGLREKV